MTDKTRFDEIIKENLMKHRGASEFGYTVPGGEAPYGLYYSNRAFRDFLAEMNAPEYRAIHDAFKNGQGAEIDERRYGGRVYPPKMASVASSARFCYLALRQGAEALGCPGQTEFEHECRITGVSGTAPQLDAYIPGSAAYFEVKCHEIFDRHETSLKAKYWPFVYGPGSAFGLSPVGRPASERFAIPFREFGVNGEGCRFDLKQFLCHLLGVSSQGEESPKLVYLFFKPKAEDAGDRAWIDGLFEELKTEITAIFSSRPIRAFAAAHNLGLQAWVEHAEVMGPLTTENAIRLF